VSWRGEREREREEVCERLCERVCARKREIGHRESRERERELARARGREREREEVRLGDASIRKIHDYMIRSPTSQLHNCVRELMSRFGVSDEELGNEQP
jgi:hypothetical protein